jgi:hypothetical protein
MPRPAESVRGGADASPNSGQDLADAFEDELSLAVLC